MMFPIDTCDQCRARSAYTRLAARDTASDETVRLCLHCDDLGQWRQSPYIQGILARIDASAATWKAYAPFAHTQPPIPPAQLVQEWLSDIAVWCAAHDVAIAPLWDVALRDAQEDEDYAKEEYREHEAPTQ